MSIHRELSTLVYVTNCVGSVIKEICEHERGREVKLESHGISGGRSSNKKAPGLSLRKFAKGESLFGPLQMPDGRETRRVTCASGKDVFA